MKIRQLLLVGMFVFASAAPVWAADDAAYVELLKNQAAQGEAKAQAILGFRYKIGRGVPQDYAEAFKWYHLAAAQGVAPAQYNLGIIYKYGEGVPQDYLQAHRSQRTLHRRTPNATRCVRPSGKEACLLFVIRESLLVRSPVGNVDSGECSSLASARWC
jgi:Sel1 repeat-containing protein